MNNILVQWYNANINSYGKRSFVNEGEAINYARIVYELLRSEFDPYPSVMVIVDNNVRRIHV